MPKQRFAVLLGGVSDEREISFQSGIMVIRALLASGHGVRPWLVEADGAFTLGRELEGETAADQLATQRGFAADALDLARRGTALETAQELRAWQPDCVFIALHGPGGEDGAIQGFLQWAGLPYTGCDVAASALGMNKVAWKALVTTCGLPTAPWTVLTAHEWNHERQSALDTGLRIAGLPAVIKVANSGSSHGVSIVDDRSQLEAALESAFSIDQLVLWESYVRGVELTCAVFGEATDPELTVFPLVEIVPKGRFFDLASKYDDGGAQEIVPARVPASVADDLGRMSRRLHRLMGASGMTRTDAILGPDGLVLLETNTIPGLTPASLYPKAAAGAGVDFKALVALIAGAGRRARRFGRRTDV